MQVWKYVLEGSNSVVPAPIGAIPLGFAMQGDSACVWMQVDPAQETEQRAFAIVGTGNDIPSDCKDYVGTAHDSRYGLVWHLFTR